MTAERNLQADWLPGDLAPTPELVPELDTLQDAVPPRANAFTELAAKLLAQHPAAQHAGDGDGLCPNPACLSGKIANYDTGQDTDCPDCVRRARLDRLARDMDASGIPASEMQTRWADVNLTHPSWRRAKLYCDNARDIRAGGYNALLVGPPGRGKSLAGALICRAFVESGYSARMITAFDLVGRVRATYNDTAAETEQQVMAQLSGVDLLVIDDLGAGETKSRSMEERIFTALIDAREKAKRPTVITSNLMAGDDLERALGFRALERIRYKAAQLIFDGPNERERKHRAEVADLDALIMGEL